MIRARGHIMGHGGEEPFRQTPAFEAADERPVLSSEASTLEET